MIALGSTRARRGAVLAALLVLGAAPARAQDAALPLARLDASPWARSFTPQAVATYVDGPRSRVLVLGAGDADPRALADATRALREALRGCGKSLLVLDEQITGSVAGLDDPAIVRKALALPVDRIVVLRIFGATAVVTMYRTDGSVVQALTVDEGAPLPSREAGSAGGGVSTDATIAVDRVMRDPGSVPVPGPRTARDEYEEGFIGVHESGEESSLSDRENFNRVYFGRLRQPLRGPGLYVRVGRPDLADAWWARGQARRALLVSGIVVGGAGIVAGGLLFAVNHMTFRPVLDNANVIGGVVMGVGVGAGLALLLPSFVIRQQPVSFDEARHLIDEHNAKRRRELGLPDDPPAPRAQAPAATIAIVPALSPAMAGVVAAGTF